MADYDGMTEEQLRGLQEQKNAELNALRKQEGKGEEIRALRQEVLAIQAAGDRLQRERYAEYDRIAAEAEGAQSTTIDADAAAAVSEAERILGG